MKYANIASQSFQPFWLKKGSLYKVRTIIQYLFETFIRSLKIYEWNFISEILFIKHYQWKENLPMKNSLKKYFPIIRSREEILHEIRGKEKLNKIYETWNLEQQEEFLNFCTGVRGVKLLYDSFFKEIMNPENVPERLEEVLSLIFKQKVRILKVLPNDSSRIADESSLLIMDIVVELTDGSIVNVEVQKIGYAFPGQRSACYSADLLLRQYKRLKNRKGKKFSYRDIKNVCTIVFFEKSTKEFHVFPDDYIHNIRPKSDTGIEIDLLQEFFFIPLDIFRNIRQNRGIRNRLEAWLTFLGEDDPEEIIKLLEKYPDFKELYQDMYKICQNTEKVMEMFSEELRILDRNTVEYMVDEMQKEIDGLKEQMAEKDKEWMEKEKEIEEKNKEWAEKDKQMAEKEKQMVEKDEVIAALKRQIEEITGK